MSELVPADEIEVIVGISRHASIHYGRAVSAEQRVYILHSKVCREQRDDLRECPFSIALDQGIDMATWDGFEDSPVKLVILSDDTLAPLCGVR